jgi:hypothetical protein
VEVGEWRRRRRGQESFARRVQRTLKGAKVVKNGSAENPALLIRQQDGDRVLKLRSELTG